MRLLKAQVENFGSYRNLSFFYENLGLALVYGPTGSGKSTLADVAPWILYGVTAKNGNADDVRSWTSPNEPTTGSLTLELREQLITITRIRGKGKNDLYWCFGDHCDLSVLSRGKDLSDSQKLLNEILGADAETFCAASYFSEFSKTANFFYAGAKERRGLFERIADTRLATRLQDRASLARKKSKSESTKYEMETKSLEATINSGNSTFKMLCEQHDRWCKEKLQKIKTLEQRRDTFEENKKSELLKIKIKISDLMEEFFALKDKTQDIFLLEHEILFEKRLRCSECGGPKLSEHVFYLEKKLRIYKEEKNKRNNLQKEIEKIKELYENEKKKENHFDEQVLALKNEVCPHLESINKLQNQISKSKELLSETKQLYEKSLEKCSDYSTLIDVSSFFRAELIKKSVILIQDQTNNLLEKYFDSEIRVTFLANEDDLEVEIFKSGYPCSFVQLSKGQRALLKLCFTVSVMESVSNHSGFHTNYLAFDEALDGLSAELKVKSFSLFEMLSLNHEAVLVIDHATELQSMFEKKFKVSIDSDESIVYEQ